jgi:hypothetical protein
MINNRMTLLWDALQSQVVASEAASLEVSTESSPTLCGRTNL